MRRVRFRSRILRMLDSQIKGVRMTVLLDKAIAAVQQLSPAQQDAIAVLILEELADEQQWDRAFAQSQDSLAKLAAKARAAIRDGKVEHAGIDEL